MSDLFDRLKSLFERGHSDEPGGLRTEKRYFPRSHAFQDAAVLLAVTERADPGVLLIHRPHAMRSHAGQVALPGGKIDPGEDAIAAALREADEELGICAQDVRLIGASDPYHSNTGFEVTPVLGVIPPDLRLTPNPVEVESWFEAPLRFLLDPASRQEKSLIRDGERRYYFEMPWEGHRIWGLTAAIFHNLSCRISHEHV